VAGDTSSLLDAIKPEGTTFGQAIPFRVAVTGDLAEGSLGSTRRTRRPVENPQPERSAESTAFSSGCSGLHVAFLARGHLPPPRSHTPGECRGTWSARFMDAYEGRRYNRARFALTSLTRRINRSEWPTAGTNDRRGSPLPASFR
jgi:hypothetical protein